MSVKTILVHFKNENQAPHLLNAAVRLAGQNQSHLIGSYIVPPLDLYTARAGEAIASGELAKIVMNEELKCATKIELLFSQACKNKNFVSEWRLNRSLRRGVTTDVLEQSRTVDLLIVSSVVEDIHSGLSNNQLGAIITHNSRPTMVVPKSYSGQSLGEFVFIAWDGSAQSSRAVFDNLPTLQLATSVWLHRIKSKDEAKRHDDETTRQLADALARHDVNVEMSESTSPARKVGAEILSRAQDRGADCIVMGAYGHSRLHGILLGNATSYVLEHSTIPSLMSH